MTKARYDINKKWSYCTYLLDELFFLIGRDEDSVSKAQRARSLSAYGKLQTIVQSVDSLPDDNYYVKMIEDWAKTDKEYQKIIGEQK